MVGSRYGQGMRHILSLLAGLVAAPLAWLLISTGQYNSQQAVADWDRTGLFDTADLVGPVAFLAAAGILLGLLGTLRLSPAGPLAAGMLFVVPTILMFINPFTTLERFYRPTDFDPAVGADRRLFGQDLQPWLPVENGTLLIIGVLLLVAVFSVQRWRQWPTKPAPIPAATDSEVVAGITALGSESTAEMPASGEPASEESAGGEPSGESTSMTDDEILAAAAAYEEPEQTEGTEETERTEEARPGNETR